MSYILDLWGEFEPVARILLMCAATAVSLRLWYLLVDKLTGD